MFKSFFLIGALIMNSFDIFSNDNPFLIGINNHSEFQKIQEDRLALAQLKLNELENIKTQNTISNTLKTYDEILTLLDAVASQSSLLENVHPDSAMRSTCEKLTQKASAFLTELSLNRKIYDALQSIDLSKSDNQTKFYLQKTLRAFRLAGVDKDDDTRKKVKSLLDELVLISQEFSRNIREDVRTISTNASELQGLPQDYISRHTEDENGKITLTINYPDAGPIFTYAHNEDLRKRMYMQYSNRAFPKNMEVLDRMIAKRGELAQILGFANYAELVTADKMVASDKNASAFIEKIAEASLQKSISDYELLLNRKKIDIQSATEINAWESGYYSELVRKTSFDFDAQKARPYFQYQKVKQGILDVTSNLFGVTFRQNKTAPVWHESVECWEMFEDGKLTGRFYLDMHPRENKYNHAAQFGIKNGILNKQIPEGALVCNFPGGDKNDPGLMEHGDVETFFHEFGHLIHHLFAGKQKWIGISGITTEWDFVEAPSQIFEEWAWDAKTLQTFAKHFETGEPIPTELVSQMKNADEFGKGLQVRQQMYYAKLSLSCYDQNPKNVNTSDLVKTLREKYTPYKFVEGTHMQASFGHLDGYSAIYYTYMWSLVIAKDLFTKFDEKNLSNPEIARKYKDNILVPGGSKPANDLVKDFLGRDFNFDGWKNWLEK
mgnify:FL=1